VKLEIRKTSILPEARLWCLRLLENKRRGQARACRRQMAHAQNQRVRHSESGLDAYAPAVFEKLETASASVL
jgi:hypothetical protein